MTTRIVYWTDPGSGEWRCGETCRQYGQPFIALLVATNETKPALLATNDLSCECEAAITWYLAGRTWMCPKCSRSYSERSLVDRIREMIEDHVRRWRIELRVPTGTRPTGRDFAAAVDTCDWTRARKLARIANQDKMPIGETGDWLRRLSVAYRSGSSDLSGL